MPARQAASVALRHPPHAHQSVRLRERSISFCRLRTFFRSPSRDAVKIRCRSRRTSSSTARQSIASQSSELVLGSVHHGAWRRRPTCSVGSRSSPSSITLHRLTRPASAPFQAGQPPLSGRLSTHRRRAGHAAAVSRCLSATGIRFSGHPVARRGFSLPHGQPTRRSHCTRPDPIGVATFRTSEIRPGWVPSRPRDGGAHPTGRLSGRRLPLHSGQPCHPAVHPIGEA